MDDYETEIKPEQEFDIYDHPETGAEIQVPKGTEVTKHILDSLSEEQSKFNELEQHQSKVQSSLSASKVLFPRTSTFLEGLKEPKSMMSFYGGLQTALKGLGAVGMDISSDVPKVAGAIGSHIGELQKDRPSSLLGQIENITQGKTSRGEPATGVESFVNKMIDDPAMIPATMLGVQGAKWAYKGGKWLPSLVKATAAGTGEGLVSSAIHQTEDVIKGEKVDPEEVMIETGLTAAIPFSTGIVGETGKNVAKVIMRSALKPAKKLTKGKGSKFKTQNIFDLNLDSMKGLKAMQSKIEDKVEEVGKQYAPLIAGFEGDKISLKNIIEETSTGILGDVAVKGKGAGSTPEIKRSIEQWSKYTDEFGDDISLEKALGLRHELDDLINYSKPEGSSERGVELFARKMRQGIDQVLHKNYPQIKELDRELSKVYPLLEATKDATHRISNRSPISIFEGMGLGLGAANVASSYIGSSDREVDVAGGMPYFVLAALLKGSRSPSVASTLYKTGKQGPTKEAVKTIAKRTTSRKKKETEEK